VQADPEREQTSSKVAKQRVGDEAASERIVRSDAEVDESKCAELIHRIGQHLVDDAMLPRALPVLLSRRLVDRSTEQSHRDERAGTPASVLTNLHDWIRSARTRSSSAPISPGCLNPVAECAGSVWAALTAGFALLPAVCDPTADGLTPSPWSPRANGQAPVNGRAPPPSVPPTGCDQVNRLDGLRSTTWLMYRRVRPLTLMTSSHAQSRWSSEIRSQRSNQERTPTMAKIENLQFDIKPGASFDEVITHVTYTVRWSEFDKAVNQPFTLGTVALPVDLAGETGSRKPLTTVQWKGVAFPADDLGDTHNVKETRHLPRALFQEDPDSDDEFVARAVVKRTESRPDLAVSDIIRIVPG
jgi:hypothetical protein